MRWRSWVAVAAVPAAVLLAVGPVWATDPVSVPSTTTPTTTTGQSTTSTTGATSTTSAIRLPQAGTSPSTTTSTSTTGTTTTTVAPADATPSGLVGVVPDWAQAEIAAYPVTPPGVTDPLLAALAPLRDLGLTGEQIDEIGFGRFPIAGHAVWGDGFLEPRFDADGSFKFHHAIDLPRRAGLRSGRPTRGS